MMRDSNWYFNASFRFLFNGKNVASNYFGSQRKVETSGEVSSVSDK